MASSERTRPRASAVVWGVLGLALLIAGMATHFYVTDAAALERQDSNLRRMERVGPPADLEPLYQSLSSDVLSLRDDKSGQAIAAATYIGTLYDWANPITGVGTLLPGGVTHVLNRLRALTPDQHAALFLAPLSALNSDAVSVLVAKKHLPATIYEADSTMDVAVLRVVLDDAALNQFPTTIPFATGPVPDKAVPLGRLVLVRNPEHGKARLVITTGGLRSQIQGGSWCDHRVDGPDVGSPIAVNTTHDGPFLIGIAGLSPAPGQCQIEGVGQFPRLISAIALANHQETANTVVLGVSVTSTAVVELESHVKAGAPGALVTGVTPGSPADLAGIRPRDVLTDVDGAPTPTKSDLIAHIRSLQPGSQHRVTVARGFGSLVVMVSPTVLGQLGSPSP